MPKDIKIDTEPDEIISQEKELDKIEEAKIGGDAEDNKTKYYARMTSDYDPIERIIIQDKFNLPSNINGDIIQVVFISSASTVGLTFRNVKHAIALESHWLDGQLTQFYGRFNRYRCQNDFPPEERWLKRYLLLSSFPDKELISKIRFDPGPKATDELIYDAAELKSTVVLAHQPMKSYLAMTFTKISNLKIIVIHKPKKRSRSNK